MLKKEKHNSDIRLNELYPKINKVFVDPEIKRSNSLFKPKENLN